MRPWSCPENLAYESDWAGTAGPDPTGRLTTMHASESRPRLLPHSMTAMARYIMTVHSAHFLILTLKNGLAGKMNTFSSWFVSRESACQSRTIGNLQSSQSLTHNIANIHTVLKHEPWSDLLHFWVSLLSFDCSARAASSWSLVSLTRRPSMHGLARPNIHNHCSPSTDCLSACHLRQHGSWGDRARELVTLWQPVGCLVSIACLKNTLIWLSTWAISSNQYTYLHGFVESGIFLSFLRVWSIFIQIGINWQSEAWPFYRAREQLMTGSNILAYNTIYPRLLS
jgi:hypothetical protein